MSPLTEDQGALQIGDWPIEGLERVDHCPVCGSDARKQLYRGLTDRVFRCAPGRWDMYQCDACRSAYLDPRPTRESIPLAYEHYYTHEPPSSESDHIPSARRRVLRALTNDYRNKRYRTEFRPASMLGRSVIPFLAPLRTPIDRKHRFLPPATALQSSLLDVGFGSGEFMRLALQMGYEVVGVDLDPTCVSNALQAGLDVRQGHIDAIDGFSRFDVITINHVLEHLHEPIETLEIALRLLRPGGMLYIETPNVDAYGHVVFREHWRGLEVPRHLVLFNWRSLADSLTRSGFTDIEEIPRFSPYAGMAGAGRALRKGANPNVSAKLHFRDLLTEIGLGVLSRVMRSRTEFISIRAWKE